MRRSVLAAACALLLTLPAAADAKIPSIATMSKPNSGSHLSFDSGLTDIKPCDGASVALRPIWLKAARAFNLRWQVLAAISKIESGFGCNMGPSSAGAIGWTQFIPSTWARWGTDADGDGRADPANAVDAVFSTARYLRVTGAPQDYRKAIFAYNHADWYVNDVLKTAETFGEFSIGEFGKLAELTRKGRKLTDRLEEMNDRLDRQRKLLAQRRKEGAEAKRQLDSASRLLAVRQRQFDQARQRVDDLTAEYIDTAVGISNGDDRPLTDEQQLLQYVADADVQDAVLVYSSARSIMADQVSRLDTLRAAAGRADTLRRSVTSLVAGRSQALQDAQTATTDAAKLVADQRVALREGRRALRKLRDAHARYAQIYEQQTGEDGSLEDSPFNEAQYGHISWEGKFRWPVSGPVTSGVGPRWGRRHEGLDIAVPVGRAVRASASGVVSFSGVQGGYGNLVIVRHGDGYETRYGHNSQLLVRRGQKVSQGQLIARSGNTGRSTGPHVHFEIRRDGKVLDPETLLPDGDSR